MIAVGIDISKAKSTVAVIDLSKYQPHLMPHDIAVR